MAKLSLCFRKEEEETYCPLTKLEINDVTIAAQGASAIIHVMTEYADNHPQGEEDNTLGIYGSVFSVLEWLMEPVRDYLFCYAGKQAEPENSGEKEQKSLEVLNHTEENNDINKTCRL